MAKNVDAEDTDKLPDKEALGKLVRRCNTLDKNMEEARGELGTTIQNAEARLNIHRQAFKHARTLHKKDAAKLYEYLRHFDHYRKALDLDSLAGQSLLDRKAKEKEERAQAKAAEKEAKEAAVKGDNVTAMKPRSDIGKKLHSEGGALAGSPA